MRKAIGLLSFAAVSMVAFIVIVVATISGSTAAVIDAQPKNAAACQPLATMAGGGGANISSLNREQRNNAKIIIDAANEVGAGPQGAQVAIATALQESHLNNLPGGDRDSVGLFQQRASWGSFEDRTNPKKSAMMFFRGGQGGQKGLMSIPGWQQMPITVAAQRVQVSAFPSAYAKWTPVAAALVKQGGGGSVTCPEDDAGAGGPKVEKAVSFALGQQGKPYVWGATGPSAFDCSGLMSAAWSKSGVKLPRTSREQFSVGKHVPVDQAKRGDLLFWSSNGSPGGIHHVAMALGDGSMVEAQQTGVPVKTSKIRNKELMPEAVRV